jgi:hypothetical protein
MSVDQVDELAEARARKLGADLAKVASIPERARAAYADLQRSILRDRPPCADVDPAVFFDLRRRDMAIELCAGCLSRVACRTYAREASVRGVWGGVVHR